MVNLSKSTTKPKEKAASKEPVAESHFDSIVNQSERLDKLDPPYVWGGGHSGFQYNPTGLDCSGAVSLVLHLAGYSVSPMDSGSLMSWGEPGVGQVTIWASPSHVFLMFANRCWAWSCPGCQNGWQPLNNYGDPAHPTTDGPYVARHPKGLGGAAGHVVEGQVSSTGGGGGSYLGVSTTAKAAAISSFIELPGLLESVESEALKGQRSLMNDKPLLPFVEQLTKASLKEFMSMPNGNFYAFVPDYFGGLTKRQPYWEIKDIEILDGMIYLTDDSLATHVYVVGDANADQEITVIDKMQTAGVVTIFNAFMANFITGIDAPKVGSQKNVTKAQKEAYDKKLEKIPSLADKTKAMAFLEKYGARPYFEEAPMIRSAYFEMFLAYQMFCLLWSQQFEAQFELTFMPELFPGGLVQFPDYGIQCYIQEVNHRGSYTEGFTTLATLIAPSALPESGRKGISAGMVRANILSPKSVDVQKPTHKQNKT